MRLGAQAKQGERRTHPRAGSGPASRPIIPKSRREALFDVTKKISGVNRQTELKEPKDKRLKYCYTMRPQSRYTSLPAGVPQELYAAVGLLFQSQSELSEGDGCSTPSQRFVDTAQSPLTPRIVSGEL